MSHLTHAQFNAAKIYCEQTLKSVLSRIEGYSFRKEVKELIIREYSLDKAQREIAHADFSYSSLDKFIRIAQRVNSFFSAVETYVAYNFDLNVSDYNRAIAESAELLASSSDAIVNAALETTDDELLRTYIRSTAGKAKYQSMDALLNAANESMKESRTYQKRAAQNARLILEKKNIEVSAVTDDAPVAELLRKKNQEAHDSEVNAATRNGVISSIIKIIKDQGFVVKKENVEECGDHAKISAIKPNGEKVNFAVYLDGKFVYKFHDYEGLSCEKDIGNFEEKFESIYGVKLEDKKIMWSNPDRTGKMAHQTTSTQKIGG